MPQGGGEHDFWPLGVEIVPGSKTPYLIDRNLLIDFHKVLYRTLVQSDIGVSQPPLTMPIVNGTCEQRRRMIPACQSAERFAQLRFGG
jgi:hypothetical protein